MAQSGQKVRLYRLLFAHRHQVALLVSKSASLITALQPLMGFASQHTTFPLLLRPWRHTACHSTSAAVYHSYLEPARQKYNEIYRLKKKEVRKERNNRKEKNTHRVHACWRERGWCSTKRMVVNVCDKEDNL